MKYFILIIISVLLVGCNCNQDTPMRVIKHNTGGKGMMYHYTLYTPQYGTSHTPSFKCPKAEYYVSDIYTDDLGTVNRNNFIWIHHSGSFEIPFDLNSRKNIYVTFEQNGIIVKGMNGEFADFNGKYKLETTSPDSWGVPIAGN
jgi:hypothetical protein